MTVLPIILLHHYCSVFPLLPSPRWTWNGQASSNCNAKWPTPRPRWCSLLSRGLGLFPEDSWHFCWKVKQYIPPGSSRQSFAGCLPQRRPLSAPELGWLGRPLLGAGADQVLNTGRFKSHMSSIEKKLVCSLSILCFLSVFTRIRKLTHGYISF